MAHYRDQVPLHPNLRQSHCQLARSSIPTNCPPRRGSTQKGGWSVQGGILKLSGPPAKLARGSTEMRIPVKLVPATRPRSVYVSDAELDRGAPSSSEATYTPKSVLPIGVRLDQVRVSLLQCLQAKGKGKVFFSNPIAGPFRLRPRCSVTRTFRYFYRRTPHRTHWGCSRSKRALLPKPFASRICAAVNS